MINKYLTSDIVRKCGQTSSYSPH